MGDGEGDAQEKVKPITAIRTITITKMTTRKITITRTITTTTKLKLTSNNKWSLFICWWVCKFVCLFVMPESL